MPNLAFVLAVVAAIFIVYGRVRNRWPIAILGFTLLALAGLLVLLGRGTAQRERDVLIAGERQGEEDRGPVPSGISAAR